ncbi:MAG: class I SAM-dependent methyltransferase [Spirochaetaceae bacterium]|nr:class I SAM-dependent methyltransferase [Spirochaetaceae bacterium]
MRNYLRENIERYRRTARAGGPADYDDFSSRGFLDEVIPRLVLHRDRPRVLELGTGIGPGAVYLAERGFAVHAVDVIPEAIAQARLIAAERGLDVRFEVMDVTRIPGRGPAYDLIVDSYCLQGIVLDADREAVFRAVKARLHPRGCYLVSSAMYAAARHRPDRQVVDGRTGRVFDRYDEESLFDAATDIHYQPYDGKEQIDGATRVNGAWYYPFRRYRTGPRLREEVESYGFKVLHQSGDLGQNLVAVHQGSDVGLAQ